LRAGTLAGKVCEGAANEGSGGADTRNLESVNCIIERREGGLTPQDGIAAVRELQAVCA
jgi:hypothetical protein